MNCKSVVLRMPPQPPPPGGPEWMGTSLSFYPSPLEPDTRLNSRDDIFEALRDYGGACVSPELLEQLGMQEEYAEVTDQQKKRLLALKLVALAAELRGDGNEPLTKVAHDLAARTPVTDDDIQHVLQSRVIDLVSPLDKPGSPLSIRLTEEGGIVLSCNAWRMLDAAMIRTQYRCRGGGIQMPASDVDELLLELRQLILDAGIELEELT